ncbi:MAG: HlyD family efflux transporter periplasmic adaptor subunit [Planctomycetota bacterium]
MIKPQLRSQVDIITLEPGRFLLSDSASGVRLEVGDHERGLLLLLDGRHSLNDICADYKHQHGCPVPAIEVLDFVGRLDQWGLVEEAGPTSTRSRPNRGHRRPREIQTISQTSTLNRFFDVMTLLLGWVIHPLCVIPLFGILIFAALGMAHQFDRYFNQLYGGVIRSYPLVPLVVLSVTQTLVFLNLPREIIIAVACRKFGVSIPAFRLQFMGRILPFFQVDASEAIHLIGRRGWWPVLFSGLLAQIAIGSIAAIGWMMARSGSGIGLFWMILVPPSVIALTVRLNIFAPFEGYAVLSYLLKVPNLRDRALVEVGQWLSFGGTSNESNSATRFWLRLFGLGLHVWRFSVWAILIGVGGWWLTSRLEGTGALLCAGLLFWGFGPQIRSTVMKTRPVDSLLRKGGRMWVRAMIGFTIAALLALVGLAPYKFEVGGECRLVASSERGVRAQLSDEIESIQVHEGDWVEKGAIIATLTAREELAAVRSTAAELTAAAAKLSLLKEGARPEEISIAEAQVEIWQIRLSYYESELSRMETIATQDAASSIELDQQRKLRDEAQTSLASAKENLAKIQKGARDQEITAAQAEVDRLKAMLAHHQQLADLRIIHAPIAGTVATPNIEERIGQAVQPGDLIAVIQDTSKLRAVLSADEAAGVHVVTGMIVNLRLWALDGKLITGRVRHVTARALDSENSAIDAVRSDREEQLQRSRDQQNEETRCIKVFVDLDPGQVTLRSGMTGFASVVIREDRFWRAISRSVLRFIRVEAWSWLP